MDENKPGKRLAETEGLSKGAKLGIGIASGVVLALVAAYLGLCAYVGLSGTILPKTMSHGVALGGLTEPQAADAIGAKLAAQFATSAVTFTYPKDGNLIPVEIPGSMVGADAAAAAALAFSQGRTQGFFAQGFHLLSNLISGVEVDAPITFTDEAGVDAILDAVSSDLEQPMVPTSWAKEGDDLVFTMGQSGLAVDKADVKAKALSAFAEGTAGRLGSGASLFALEPITEAPPAVDLESIQKEILVEVSDARLDSATKEIVPAVTGVSFDIGTVRTALAAAPEGSVQPVPLVLTKPQITTETLTASLFRDVLGEATSRVGGSANRKANVKLSALVCNDQILLPGDIFAYNQTTGSRSAAAGYLPAPAYVNGLSVQELGGGICQTSSTIYYATLNANLKIVERKNHMYAVGYVPDGMDATVYYGSLDFRFENDTPYPIKIVTESYDKDGSRWLTVKIVGTKTTENYVKMTKELVSTIPYETVYKADPNVPQGSAPRQDPQSTGYTGKKVNAYRNIYSPDGKLISSTLESVNNYRKRDNVLLVNPADLATYQAGGKPGAVVPEVPPVVPSVTPTPSITPPVEAPVTPPVEVTLPPAEVTPPPAEVTPPPAEVTPPPAEVTPPPAEVTPPPAEVTPPPAEMTPPPVVVTLPPEGPVMTPSPTLEPTPGIPVLTPPGSQTGEGVA